MESSTNRLSLFSFKIFLSITFLLSSTLSFSQNSETPEFQKIKYNNIGLVVDLGVGLWAWPLPTDYDGDGDYDLLVSCPGKPYNGIYFFENTEGNVKMPVFKPGKRISKAYRNIQSSYVNNKVRYLIPGKEIISFGNEEIIEIYPTENIHIDGNRIRANQWKYCDFDGDENLDIVVSVGDWKDYGWDNAFDEKGVWKQGPLHGYLYLIKNDNTTEHPKYKEPELIYADEKPIDVYGMPSANFADFDNDGDLDIVCGEFVDKFTYFENIGCRTKPKYSSGRVLTYLGNPITMDLEMIIPVAIDWDKDGDVDLIVGQEDGRVAFIENTGKLINNIPQFNTPTFFEQQADDVKFGTLVTPYSIDWDNDGDEDLICGNTAGYIGFIENLGGGENPKWAEPTYLKADDEIIRIQAGYNGSIQGPCEAKWGYTTLSVGDWDNDGLPDIIINSIWGKIIWFKNIGTKTNPKLKVAQSIKVEWNGKNLKPFWNWWKPKGNNLVTQWRTTPLIIDWNKDGLNDLIMLDHEGYLSFFERIKVDNELKLLPGKHIFYNEKNELLQLNIKTAGGSGRRKLTIVDWDLDGKLDLLVNSKNVDFYKNISETDDKIVFENLGMISEQILAGHTTSPTTVDWDKNGIPDLLLGAEDGYFYFLKNPNDNK
ncbi:MAG: VCBS repeat-containing protein [Melioribacteraceae bacterium]